MEKKRNMALGLLFGAAVLIAFAGGLFLAGKNPNLPMAPTTLGFLLSTAVVILTFAFVMLKPKGFHGTGLQGGISLFPAAGGGVLGILGSVMLAKFRADEDRVAWEAELGGPNVE